MFIEIGDVEYAVDPICQCLNRFALTITGPSILNVALQHKHQRYASFPRGTCQTGFCKKYNKNTCTILVGEERGLCHSIYIEFPEKTYNNNIGMNSKLSTWIIFLRKRHGLVVTIPGSLARVHSF